MSSDPEVGPRPLVSLIVPVRDEGPEVVDRFAPFAGRPDCELLVVDAGGSREAVERFAAAGARTVPFEGTRGRCLDEAARQAAGEILLFFHADSRPPEGAVEAARAALSAGAVAGAFSLDYEGSTPAMRCIAWWANARARALRLPFGDQGLFCRRVDYLRAGGFRDLPICDDLDIVRRLRKRGRFTIRPEKSVTSPRRYRQNGALRQVLRNWRVQLGFFAGVAPETLARWYSGGRARSPSTLRAPRIEPPVLVPGSTSPPRRSR
jgi:rSAM/selenodomain-associated transferase 2